MTKEQAKMLEMERQNVEAAQIVLSEPERYLPDGLMAEWARAILAGRLVES